MPDASLQSELGAANVQVRFQGVAALQDASVKLKQGQVIGLIGPNGAGKTTLLNVLSGFQRPSSGTVHLGALDLSRIGPAGVRRSGVSRTFQSGRLFPGLSVLQNLAAAGIALGARGSALANELEEILDWAGLGRMAASPASTLAYSDQRRVSIARGLVGRPAFLLLDEPAAGMSQPECADLVRLVTDVPRRFGAGVLMVEHNVRLVMETCTSIQVLSGGRSIASGAASDVLADRHVIEAYLGRSLE